MRKRISGILALISLLALGYWFMSRLESERQFLKYTLEVQKNAVAAGWKAKWLQRLKEELESGALVQSHTLNWDRFTYDLKENFYPSNTALDWSEFTSLQNKGDFISSALSKNGSWDRILALTYIQREQPSEFSGQTLSKFERTLFDDSAAAAFTSMIAQAEQRPAWQYADREVEFNQVFYRASDDGKIETLLPDLVEAKEKLLEDFLVSNSIPGASFGPTVLDITFNTDFSANNVKAWTNHLPLVTAFAFAIVAALFFASGLKKDEKEILRKVSFLNQVVHELKTPLAGLKLHLQLIREHGFDEESLESSEISVARMQSLFDDIYYLQKPDDSDAKKMTSVKRANEILEDLKNQYPDQLELTGAIEKSLNMNPAQFKIVAANLVRNAIRYGDKCRIRISIADKKTRIEIKDDGPGVSKTDSSKIFNEFYRSQSAQNSSPDGLGLGLAICKKLCDQSGSEIKLMNPGQPKALFQLTIPEAHDA